VVTIESGVYRGVVRHRRFVPVPHEFQYQLFMSLLDIDRVDALVGVSPLVSRNRWNLATFDDRDHLGDPKRSLRDRLRDHARDHDTTLPDGPVFLLTHLRYAGYVFNPISLYYCCDDEGRLRRVLADVRNTYGGRRSYWLDPVDDVPHRFRASAAKSLYVSPFMPMAADYEFLLTRPADTLVAHMNVTSRDGGERMFDATLELERRPWTAGAIHRALAGYPLMTAKVIAAIHYQAIKLRLRGVPEQPATEGKL
jgi:uncharacterized protein